MAIAIGAILLSNIFRNNGMVNNDNNNHYYSSAVFMLFLICLTPQIIILTIPSSPSLLFDLVIS